MAPRATAPSVTIAPARATRGSSASVRGTDEGAAANFDSTSSAPANAPAGSPPATTSSALAAEIAMLDQARAAVAAKTGDRALDVLGRYARQFPSGTLGLEATVLRIEALYLTGATGAATALGRDFLASHPTSTHATHVRRLLAEHDKP
jgi:hypothetical protein